MSLTEISKPTFDESKPDDIRSSGWMVAVHNDYLLAGEFHTFWLFTNKQNEFVKGEGKTDAEALNQVRFEIKKLSMKKYEYLDVIQLRDVVSERFAIGQIDAGQEIQFVPPLVWKKVKDLVEKIYNKAIIDLKKVTHADDKSTRS